MRIIIILSLFLFCNHLTNGQNSQAGTGTSSQVEFLGQQDFAQLGTSLNASVDPISMEIEGSKLAKIGNVYSTIDFVPGWVLAKALKDTIFNMQLRYNYLKEALMWKKDESHFYYLNQTPIHSFGIDDEGTTRVFINSNRFRDPALRGYIESVFQGDKVAIYLDVNIDQKAIEKEPYGAPQNTIKYVQVTRTYFEVEGELVRVKNKKDLNAILSSFDIPSMKASSSDLKNPEFLRGVGRKMEPIN